MKTQNIFFLIVVLGLLTILTIARFRKNDTIPPRGVSDSMVAKLQPLLHAPVATITADTITEMADVPTHLLAFAFLSKDSLACLWLNQQNNPEAIPMFISIDSGGFLVVNSALVRVNDTTLQNITVGHAFPDEIVDKIHGWKSIPGTDILISATIIPKNKHCEASIAREFDTVALCGYRIIEGKRKMVYYTIIGKPIEVTSSIQDAADSVFLLGTHSSEAPAPRFDITNSNRCYALKLPLDFFDSVRGLSGSGIYRVVNGKITKEIVGIQSQRFAFALVTSEEAKNPVLANSMRNLWIIFQKVNESDFN